jgi:hypothetical protein
MRQSLNTRYLHGRERPDGKLVEVRVCPADCGAYTGYGLDSGREYFFIGDVAWTLANVTQLKLRPAATMRRINEPPRWVTMASAAERLRCFEVEGQLDSCIGTNHQAAVHNI